MSIIAQRVFPEFLEQTSFNFLKKGYNSASTRLMDKKKCPLYYSLPIFEIARPQLLRFVANEVTVRPKPICSPTQLRMIAVFKYSYAFKKATKSH